MKRFSFSLQKVLQLRKYREEECKLELGKAVGALTEIENSINAVASSRRLAALERFSAADDMLIWENYITRLDKEADKLMEEAAQAELVVEEKRELYLEASRELKAMEKLKEKKKEEHRKTSLAAQTAELDIIQSYSKFARNSLAAGNI